MAFVDFSNAVLHLPSNSNFNITDGNYAALNNNQLSNSASVIIVTSNSVRILKDETNKITLIYTGNFTQSGNEFYFGAYNAIDQKYKMTGITFEAGDTYSFQISANLTCQ